MSEYYWNSTIKKKPKRCRLCGLPKILYSRGRCEPCARREDARPISAAAITRPPKAMNAWFDEQRSLMTGFCMHCGQPSCRDDDRYYKFSAAHILPKALFPSIALHPCNGLELCHWPPNCCHTNYDTGMLDLIDMHCFDAIIERFQKMYPSIAPAERRRIPQILMQYVHINI